MRVFRTKSFTRFARRERLPDPTLLDAIARAERGLVDADLGGGLIKQRVGRSGQGRSGGYRTLIAYRRGDLAIFLFGFAKNERENINGDELLTLKELADALLSTTSAIDRLVQNGGAEEVPNE